MEIEAELPIPLGNCFYIKHKGEKEEDVTDILDNEPKRAIAEITKIVNSIIKKKESQCESSWNRTCI